MTDQQTPATEAGPTTQSGIYFTEHFFDMRPHDIIAIEAEARALGFREGHVQAGNMYEAGRAAERERLAEAVRASLPRLPYIDVKRRRYVERVAVESAVLAILDPEGS